MTPLELASGYAVFANGGFRIEPYFIERIELDDKVIRQANPVVACNDNCTEIKQDEDLLLMDQLTAPEPSLSIAPKVMSPQVNYIMNDILDDVIWKGTGQRAKVLKRHDLGGKTGTTNDSKDAWFVGFNPDVLTAVWLGMDDHSTLGRWEYGANAALPIWVDYMQTSLADKPEHKRIQPEGLVTLKISEDTGQLASPGDPRAIFEIFRQEHAPQQLPDEITPSSAGQEQGLVPGDIF